MQQGSSLSGPGDRHGTTFCGHLFSPNNNSSSLLKSSLNFKLLVVDTLWIYGSDVCFDHPSQNPTIVTEHTFEEHEHG